MITGLWTRRTFLGVNVLRMLAFNASKSKHLFIVIMAEVAAVNSICGHGATLAPCNTISCRPSLPAPPRLVPDWVKEGQQQYVMQRHFHTDLSAVAFAEACNLQQEGRVEALDVFYFVILQLGLSTPMRNVKEGLLPLFEKLKSKTGVERGRSSSSKW